MKLSAGVLSLLLDTDEAFEARHHIKLPREGSVQDRWRQLERQIKKLPNAENVLEEIDGKFAEPKKLLSRYSTKPLREVIDIPASAKPYVKDFLETLVDGVEVKSDVRFQLPEPLFHCDEDSSLRGLALAFRIPPRSTDLSTIAYDGPKRLALVEDRPAFAELQKSGVYKRGDFDLSFSWYAGLKKITSWRHKSWAESLYVLRHEAPEYVAGMKDPSLFRGLSQLVVGLGVTMNRLLGVVPSFLPKFTEQAIAVECSKEYFSWLEHSQGFKLVGTELSEPFMVKCKNGRGRRIDADTTTTLVPYPAIYEHASRGTLDLRTQIPSIRIKLDLILHNVKKAVDKDLGPRRMSMIASWSRTLGKDEAIEKYLQAWHRAYIDGIEAASAEIDRLSCLPDLTKTVLLEQEAMFTLSRMRESQRVIQENAVKERLNVWVTKHPIKALCNKFVDRELANITRSVGDKAVTNEMFMGALLEKGLTNVALLIQTQSDFEKSEQLADKLREMRAAKEAHLKEVNFLKLPSRWTVRSFERGGRTRHEIDMHRKMSLPSSLPLWRVVLLGTRPLAMSWNANFFLANVALVGMRRWNPSRKDFDVRTGTLRADGQFATRKLRTLRGRIAALHGWRRHTLEEARSSEHIIRLGHDLYLDMCWAHFWTCCGVVIGDVSVTASTTAETVGRILLAAGGMATSPIWSLFGSVACSLWNALVYDSDLPHPPTERIYDGGSRSPLTYKLFGIPNIVLSVAMTAWKVSKGTVTGVSGEVRHAWNRSWHGLMTWLLKHAEVPSQAEGFFWSTSSKNPFVLINANAALLAMLVYLSREELEVARQQLIEDLDGTKVQLQSKILTDSAGSLSLQDISMLQSAIAKSDLENIKAFNQDTTVSSAQRRYEEFLQAAGTNPWVRMERDELESFLSRAVPVVRKFYVERYFPRVAVTKVAQFWESRDLTPGDWTGLAERVASAIFGREIAVAFEAAEDDLVVEPNRQSGLEAIVRQSLEEQGVVTGLSTDFRVGHPIKVEKVPRQPTYEEPDVKFVPVAGGDWEADDSILSFTGCGKTYRNLA